jgi:O-6-methylguanine DNA methyltransferase
MQMNLISTESPSQSARLSKHKIAATSNAINYSIGVSSLDKVLVARSAIGVCAILIGSAGEALKHDLAARFPGRKLIEGELQLREDMSKVLRFIESPNEGLDLPLDMRHGTEFQRKVWDALRTIPCGAVVTYAALAQRIGRPNSIRAVANACAANAIALGIPCHRVILSNSTLSGYRWGVERKRALLDKEALI